ncbi:membrane protein [Actinoplanes ianthinogenes]|uniref:Membrane protein n=1 Tax=Actinoplanes ianthinogenes TaxID=122358 RepID=A0ABM7LNZ1_9ACTN|nr:metal ABC transporter permease [Actinoplanes ianthinogenes]BCJ40989.1 membrane protein [Actinoplanes ianthinogenes]GGR23707.1 membrane protein [Actinoplanes ianthinogenes]
MSWWDDAVHRAVAEALLAGALGAIVGVRVVVRRLSFFTMALTHATFPGVVAAALLGINVMIGGVVAGTVVTLGVVALGRRAGQGATAATGVLLSAGFALGAALVATRNGFGKDLSALLTGSVLAVGDGDLIATGVVLALVAAVLLVFGRQLTFSGFDPAGARSAGLAVPSWDLLLLLTVQVTVVAMVPAVGTFLAVALIVAPAAAARLWSDRIPVITALAVLFGTTSGLAGLYASARWNVAAGAAITLAAASVLPLSMLLSWCSRSVPGRGLARVATGPGDVRTENGS